jgi:hypothetical protein
MTSSQWLASKDPAWMLNVAFGNWTSSWRGGEMMKAGIFTRRKMILLCAAFCRMKYPPPGPDAVWREMAMGGDPDPAGFDPKWNAIQWVEASREEDRPPLADVIRDTFGDPFNPMSADPAWLTPTVKDLARAAWDHVTPAGSLDPARLAVLSDALEEAGCVGEKIVCPTCGGKDYYSSGDRMSDMFPSTCPRCRRRPYQKDGGTVDIPNPILASLRSPGVKWRGFDALDVVLGQR